MTAHTGDIQPRCLSIKQPVHYLGSSVWHIRSLCWSGKLTHIRAGKRIVIDRNDLDRWIDRAKSA